MRLRPRVPSEGWPFDDDGGSYASLGPQAFIWFGVAGGAAAFGFSLLYARYIRRDDNAVRSGGGFTLFAVFMFACALGALAAGIVAARVGR